MIIVTGATGFVGRYFIKTLVQKYSDEKIVCLTNDRTESDPDRGHLAGHPPAPPAADRTSTADGDRAVPQRTGHRPADQVGRPGERVPWLGGSRGPAPPRPCVGSRPSWVLRRSFWARSGRPTGSRSSPPRPGNRPRGARRSP